MKTIIGCTSSVLLATVATLASAPALASSHSEAPAVASDPDVDNADVWAWVKGTNLIVVATFNGLQPAYAAPNWKKFADEGALYEIHIAKGPASLADFLTYQIRFTTADYPYVDPGSDTDTPSSGNEFFSQISGGGAGAQTYRVTKIDANGNATQVVTAANPGKVAPPNIGPRTNAIAYGIPGGTTYEQFFVDNAATSVVKTLGAGEGRIFAGPRDDPFYVDLAAVFDLAGLRSVIGGTPRDSVQFYNVMSITLEIPLTVANGGAVVPGTPNDNQTVGVWASASRREITILRNNGTKDSVGPFKQVSRLGLPLINEAVIGLQDKDRFNRKRPKDDAALFAAYFLNPVIVRDAQFAGFYGGGGPLAACSGNGGDDLRTNRTDIIDVINLKNIPSANAHNLATIGDVLRVDLGITSGFPNGRPLVDGAGGQNEDVVDVELGMLLCKLAALVPDGVNGPGDGPNKATFPYMAPPWESFASGVHGPPAP